MNLNNINNSGNGNIFNQNIGNQTIDGIFDINELARERYLREINRKRAFRSRTIASIIKVGISLVLLSLCLLCVWMSGGFDSFFAFWDFLRDLSISLIVSIITLLAGVLIGSDGCRGFIVPSDDEIRNKEVINEIDCRASDLGFKKKAWKNAKKVVKNDGI